MKIRKERVGRTGIRLIVWPLIALAAGIIVWKQTGDPYSGKAKAQRISCVNNLKQIGLAFRIWSGDNDDKYPFDVSTNSGGAMELCIADREGFVSNPTALFKAIQWELSTTKILVCPKDKKRRFAPDFETLTHENISYRVRALTNVNENAHEVLIVCPIDGNILYTDGKVKGDYVDPHAMRVP